MRRSRRSCGLICMVICLCLAGRVVGQESSAGKVAEGVERGTTNNTKQKKAGESRSSKAAGSTAGDGLVHARPLVLLDVIVTGRNGKPIRDLRPEDITVFEDGEPQKIALFQFHNPPAGSSSAAAKAGSDVFTNTPTDLGTAARNIIVIDAMTSDWMSDRKRRSNIIGFVEQMPLDRPLAIFLLLRTGSRILQDFTMDREAIRLAAAKLEPELAQAVSGFVSERQQVSELFQLRALLGGYSGRKNVILVSNSLNQAAWRSSLVQGTYFLEDGRAVPALLDSQVVHYAVDPGGGLPRVAALTTFHKRMLYGSGGLAFSLDGGHRQAVYDAIENGSSYYWVGYYPANEEWENRFRVVRRVEVEVKRRDAVADYLHAYESRFAEADSDLGRREAMAALSLDAPAMAAVHFRARVTASGASQRKAVVEYAIEARSLGLRRGEDGREHASFACAVTAYDRNRKLVNANGENMEAVLAPAALRNAGATLRLTQEIELPPGHYVLKLAVFDRYKGVNGTVTADVVIPEERAIGVK